MEEYIKKYARNSIIISILLIILSFFLMFKPMESVNTIMIILGAIVSFYGIVHIVTYFSMPKEYKIISFELVQGVVFVILGIVTIINPQIINGFLTYILGAWIIIQSIIRIQLAFNIKDGDSKTGIIFLLLGFISFLLGVLIVVNPFGAIEAITTICGIMLLISETLNIGQSIFILKS